MGKDASGVYDVFQYSLEIKKNESPFVYSEKPKILIIGAQHGYEKGSAYTLYYLIKELIENWHSNPILEF